MQKYGNDPEWLPKSRFYPNFDQAYLSREVPELTWQEQRSRCLVIKSLWDTVSYLHCGVVGLLSKIWIQLYDRFHNLILSYKICSACRVRVNERVFQVSSDVQTFFILVLLRPENVTEHRKKVTDKDTFGSSCCQK